MGHGSSPGRMTMYNLFVEERRQDTSGHRKNRTNIASKLTQTLGGEGRNIVGVDGF